MQTWPVSDYNMCFRKELEIALLLLSAIAIIPTNGVFQIGGSLYYDTYIYDTGSSGQPLTVHCFLDARFYEWTSSVTGRIPTNSNFQGVRISIVGNVLVFDSFIPALSGVYTCSAGIQNSSILLTTTNPSLNILSAQPVKMYNGASKFQLSISSYYFVVNESLQTTPANNITIGYYSGVLPQTVNASFDLTRQGSYQVIVSTWDATLPSGTTFFIRVESGNGPPVVMSFKITRVALYIAQLPMEMIVVAGDNVTIDCSPSDPIINVNVTFSPLDTTVQELLTNAATYDIPSITRSSSGIYECFGYAPWSDTFTTDFISTEMVALTVLPDPVAIEFNGKIIVNVSVINADTNNATLTCLGAKGNSRLQWMTYNETVNGYLSNAYQTLANGYGGADLGIIQLKIMNSANSAILVINNVDRYSNSFVYCVSQESGNKAMTVVTRADPFVISHPDLPIDAALGENLKMMFVVGTNSDGTTNLARQTATGTIAVELYFNDSTLLYSKRFEQDLPYTIENQIPISTASEGYYTFRAFIRRVEISASIITFLRVIVPSVAYTSSPMNVLQSTLVTLSCVPSDLRAPVVWEHKNATSQMFEGIQINSAYRFGFNGHSISFNTLLIPASFQELGLSPLPDPSLRIIKPKPTIQPTLYTHGSETFRCSLVNGSTEKVLPYDMVLNSLRDPIQMAVTFKDGSKVTLLNDTTLTIPTLPIQTLECWVQNGLGTPELWRNGDPVLLNDIPLDESVAPILSTNSVRVNVPNAGYYMCSVSHGEVFVFRLTVDNPFIINEGGPHIIAPLGRISLLYFQLAASSTNGLTNEAFSDPSSVVTNMQSFSLGAIFNTSLSQNASGLSFTPYVVGPTSLALYINPVKLINAGIYTVTSTIFNVSANVTLNITIPTLSVEQSKVSVLQSNSAVITCKPSHDGVQIQWTFLSTNTVLATGYQYSYTINASTPDNEGLYVCSIFGDDTKIVKPQTVYVDVIAVCPTSYGAGVLWNVAHENQTLRMPCSEATTAFSPITQMSRQCLPSGQWGEVDFTGCTLRSGVSRPFTLYWTSLVDVAVQEYEGSIIRRIPGINVTYNRINISSSTGLFSQNGNSIFAIFISAYFNNEQLDQYYPFIYFKRQAVSPSLSYAVIRPSDPCRCRPSLGNEFYLCSDVLSGPCYCTNDTNCQCTRPFVGNGDLCTMDSDLDGVPNNALNCTGFTYCLDDNCPFFYNPPIDGIQRDVCSQLLKDGCNPVNDLTWNLQWPSTALNTTYVQPCPQGGINNVSGYAYRVCSSNGEWSPTDVTQCESYIFMYLAEQVSLPSLDITQGLGIVTDLFIATQPNSLESKLPLDLRDSLYILSTVLSVLNTNLQHGVVIDVQSTVVILDVINNILNETNQVGWEILQMLEPNSASALLLKTSESYGLYLASAINTSSTITKSRSSIVIQASKILITTTQADIRFPDSNDALFVNATFSASDASILIPGSLLLERGNNAQSIPVVNMIIKNINAFLPRSGSLAQQVDSFVLSSQVAVEDGGFASKVLKKRPVIITFRINKPSNLTNKYQCSFWNFSNSSWSSEGMLPPLSNGSFVQCYSTHLTSFAVLLAVDNFPDSEALTIISYIGCGISMACLLATIVFFLTFRKKLLEKPHYFIHLNLAIALFLAFLVFVAGVETAKHNEAACKAVAALLQYLWLSAFCWMMCEGVMLYLMLVVVFSTLKDKWWFFFLLGWVPALMFVVIGLAVRSEYYVVRSKSDNKAISYCWMSIEKGTIWAFAAPVVLIMMINIMFLIMVIVVLARKSRSKLLDAKDVKHRTIVVSLIKSAVILLPILGCTWIFGLLSVNQYTLVFTWLFTILNSLQGFLIFLLYVLRHEKVWGRITKRFKVSSSSKRSEKNMFRDSAGSHAENKSNIYSDVKSSSMSMTENENSKGDSVATYKGFVGSKQAQIQETSLCAEGSGSS